jgi:dolichol kinase
MKTKITRNLFLTGQILFEFTTYFTSDALVLGVLQKLENVKTIAIYNRVWEVTFCSTKFNLKHDAQRSVS